MGPIALPEGRTEAITHPLSFPQPSMPYSLLELRGGALVFRLELDLDTHFFFNDIPLNISIASDEVSITFYSPFVLTLPVQYLKKHCHPVCLNNQTIYFRFVAI